MVYSRRKRLAEKTEADVYQYVDMSPKLRQQIMFVFAEWNNKLTGYSSMSAVFDSAVFEIRKELGKPKLIPRPQSTEQEFSTWFLTYDDDLDQLLNSIEYVVDAAVHSSRRHSQGEYLLERGIAEINARALEDGFGFQVEGGQIIEIGGTFTHKEITVPALHLLNGRAYAEANKEFRQAYHEFNRGNYDDCIHDCCNAFESVLKVIFTNKNWDFNQTDPAKKLLAIAFSNDLIPTYMQNEFTGLRTILETGVPVVRNKEAGHGTGAIPRVIPKYIAAFQLHQTAAAIIMLIEAGES